MKLTLKPNKNSGRLVTAKCSPRFGETVYDMVDVCCGNGCVWGLVHVDLLYDSATPEWRDKVVDHLSEGGEVVFDLTLAEEKVPAQ